MAARRIDPPLVKLTALQSFKTRAGGWVPRGKTVSLHEGEAKALIGAGKATKDNPAASADNGKG